VFWPDSSQTHFLIPSPGQTKTYDVGQFQYSKLPTKMMTAKHQGPIKEENRKKAGKR
jgi:hypothetical protein